MVSRSQTLLWISSMSICCHTKQALELIYLLQDDHHYLPTWYHQKPLSMVLEKDCIHKRKRKKLLLVCIEALIKWDIKRNMLLQRGETLILIPCWWDGSETRFPILIFIFDVIYVLTLKIVCKQQSTFIDLIYFRLTTRTVSFLSIHLSISFQVWSIKRESAIKQH